MTIHEVILIIWLVGSVLWIVVRAGDLKWSVGVAPIIILALTWPCDVYRALTNRLFRDVTIKNDASGRHR